jgi:hypothetical protein
MGRKRIEIPKDKEFIATKWRSGLCQRGSV